MGVATAAWLGALASLAIPLAIHLWSRRRTTPVAIGSIRFLQSVKPVSKRTIRLRHPWRLLLRVALLTSLILALAGVYLEGILPDPAPERWLVVSQAADGRRAAHIIDSLSAEADTVLETPGDVWSKLVSVDAILAPGSSIDVVAPAVAVRGTRPTMATSVRWFPVGAAGDGADRPARWSGLHHDLVVFASRDRWDDGRYLTAALRAIVAQDTAPGTVRLLEANALDGVLDATWVAWLSADLPPEALLEHTAAGGVLLTDVAGDQLGAATTIALPQPAVLSRRGPTPTGVPIWRDGNGVTLLAAEPAGSGIHYRLAIRLHPAWTDLVMQGSFPAALMPLIGTGPAHTKSPVTVAQILPRRADAAARHRRTAGPNRSLFAPLWLLALGLFAVDVGLMFRRRRTSE